MKNPYYILWTDAIVNNIYYKNGGNEWKYEIFLFYSFMQTLNVSFIIICLKYFKIIDLSFDITLFSSEILNNISFYIVSALPLIFINYFLILHKNRYMKIINNYPHYNGKFAIIYFLISLLLIATPMFMGW